MNSDTLGTGRCTALTLVASLLVVACGGETASVPTSVPKSQIRIVSGASTGDTIQSTLPAPLVLEVDVGGAPSVGTTVQLSAVQSSDPARNLEHAVLVAKSSGGQPSTTATATTDATGRVTLWPVLGTIAGDAKLLISVPAHSLSDTAHFTVGAGASTRFAIAVRDTAISPAAQYSIGAVSYDRFNNTRPVTYGVATGAATVDGAGSVRAASTPGRVRVAVRDGTRTDTAFATIVPPDFFYLGSQPNAFFRARLDLSQRTDYASPFGAISALLPDGHHVVGKATYPPGNNAPTQDGIYLLDLQDPSTKPTLVVPVTPAALGFAFLTVSSDGQWVYYSAIAEGGGKYSIWRSRIDGTKTEQLTTPGSNGSSQSFPAISPDGSTLAYSDVLGGLTIMNLVSGTKTVLVKANAGYPSFSPDGRRIAYLSGNLHVANVDGSGITHYNMALFGYDNFSVWTRDAQWIVSSDNTYLFMTNISSGEVVPIPGVRFVTRATPAP